MKKTLKLKNQTITLKSFIPIVLIIFYWFYNSVCFGYFLSRIFYNIFDIMNENSISASIQLRKKLNLKNFIRTIIYCFWKFIQNWWLQFYQKFLLLWNIPNQLIKIIALFLKKVLINSFKFFRVINNIQIIKGK